MSFEGRVSVFQCVALLGVTLLAACGSGSGDDDDAGGEIACTGEGASRSPLSEAQLPPAGGSFDYQLGGAYAVPAGVNVVSRDSGDAPAPGVYNICYLNAFQTQPDADWSGAREPLLLHDARGRKVSDPDWPDEYVLDVSTLEQRNQLVEIVGGWINECADRGFDAVELDNLDTFTRFPQQLQIVHTATYALQLLDIAHARSLAVAQKNTAEASACFHALGFDFVVSEECWQNEGDCAQYSAQYPDRVFDVEYAASAFQAGCRAAAGPPPILRDRDLVVPGPGYVRQQCP